MGSYGPYFRRSEFHNVDTTDCYCCRDYCNSRYKIAPTRVAPIAIHHTSVRSFPGLAPRLTAAILPSGRNFRVGHPVRGPHFGVVNIVRAQPYRKVLPQCFSPLISCGARPLHHQIAHWALHPQCAHSGSPGGSCCWFARKLALLFGVHTGIGAEKKGSSGIKNCHPSGALHGTQLIAAGAFIPGGTAGNVFHEDNGDNIAYFVGLCYHGRASGWGAEAGRAALRLSNRARVNNAIVFIGFVSILLLPDR